MGGWSHTLGSWSIPLGKEALSGGWSLPFGGQEDTGGLGGLLWGWSNTLGGQKHPWGSRAASPGWAIPRGLVLGSVGCSSWAVAPGWEWGDRGSQSTPVRGGAGAGGVSHRDGDHGRTYVGRYQDRESGVPGRVSLPAPCEETTLCADVSAAQGEPPFSYHPGTFSSFPNSWLAPRARDVPGKGESGCREKL